MIMGLGTSRMSRDSNDSFTLDNGVVFRETETPSSKRPNRESHPLAPSPSINSVRGGKTRGKDEAE